MTNRLYESEIEQIALDILHDDNGYAVAFGPELSEGARKEREYSEVVLHDRLREAIDRLNPVIPVEAREEAAKKAQRSVSVNLLENNEAFHRMLTDGIDVKSSNGDGKTKTDKVWLVDFANPDNNEFLAVNQYTVLENHNNKRPDVVLLVNGLPLVVMELKNAADENADVKAAFNQFTDERNGKGFRNGKERFKENVVKLQKVFSLSVPHPKAYAIGDDLALFQAIKALR